MLLLLIRSERYKFSSNNLLALFNLTLINRDMKEHSNALNVFTKVRIKKLTILWGLEMIFHEGSERPIHSIYGGQIWGRVGLCPYNIGKNSSIHR